MSGIKPTFKAGNLNRLQQGALENIEFEEICWIDNILILKEVGIYPILWSDTKHYGLLEDGVFKAISRENAEKYRKAAVEDELINIILGE